MLSWIRGLLENWIARVFFGLLVAVFVFWGISNVLTLVGGNSAVAHIRGKPIDLALLQSVYQAQLTQAQQGTAGQPDLAARQQLAGNALRDVLRQQVLRLQEQALGLTAPAAAIRQAVYAIPAFQTNNAFDEAKFSQLLQANGRTAEQFLAEVKDNILGSQLVLPVIAGAAAPRELANQIFSYVAEQRFAETVAIPLSGQPVAPAPGNAVLQRYWRNHQADFAAPEIREVKIVLLSPALLAGRQAVSDAELAAAYARVTAGQAAVPLRSVQIITINDAKKAAVLGQSWRAGAGWNQMQALATKAGGNPVELDKAQQTQFPSPRLGDAVFAAAPNAVTGPLPGPSGFFVFKVTDVRSSVPPQADLQAAIKQQLQLQKAQAEVAQDVDNVQDALAGQTPLDKLPGNLGLVAVEGSLDAEGNAADGTPAPIPGGKDLKAAVVKAAFAAHLHEPAQLVNGPDGSYFALTVDSITPASTHPYEQVKDKVASAWNAAQNSRQAEVKAAALLAAVNGGQSLDAAASVAGYAVSMTPPVTRNAPPSGVAGPLVQILFSLQPGQATMQQTDSGFMVAVLAKVVRPKPAEQPDQYAQVVAAMAKSLQNDIAESLIAGLQSRDKVTVNQKLFAQLYQ